MWRFSSSKKSDPLNDFYADSYEKLFPWWQKQIEEMAKGILEVVNNKIDLEEAKSCYTQVKFRLHMGVSLGNTEDKTLWYFWNVIDKYSNWKLEDDDIRSVLWYIMKNDEMVKIFASMVWLLNDPMESDEIPEGQWEFGYSLDNPIPIKWVSANRTYLDNLRTEDWDKITYNRLWSNTSNIIKDKNIDIYEIFDQQGSKIATIHLCPYYWKTSNKAPKGFVIDKNEDIQ